MLETNKMQSAAEFKSRLDAIICKQSIDRLPERVKYSLLQKLEKGECKHCVELNEQEISEQIEIVLQNLYIPQEYLEQIKNDVKKRVDIQAQDQKKEIKILQAQYEEADKGLKDIRHQRFVTKELPDEDYIELKAELQVKRDNEKASIDLLAQDDKEFEIGVEQVLKLIENATEIWKSS